MLAELWTIGHSNHPIDRFVKLLQGAGITAVADVRSRPHSRFAPQFNRERLRQALIAVGISYLWLGAELGGLDRAPPEVFERGLDRLLEEAQRHRVAILCAEKDPAACHRGDLIAPALEKRGVAVRHILADGTVRRAMSRVGG